MFQNLQNPFLQTYLKYVEDTETPRIMHIWTALAGAGACLGRRVYLPFGITDIYANMFVLLVGPPGMRKSTALNIMQERIKSSTNIRFTPDDTAGARQGLIIALENKDETASEKDEAELRAAVAAIDLEVLNGYKINIDSRDEHTMFAVASEFGSFIGTNAGEMTTFLNRMFDGEDYDYKIRTNRHILRNPLLSLIAGTTPINIATSLPSSAIGHGFTSRIVLVFANRKYKKVSRPKKLDPELAKYIDDLFGWLYHTFDGEMVETEGAKKLIDDLYDVEVKLNDPRFIYYLDRRQQHLYKTAIILAACRKDREIKFEDVQEANLLLTYTEQFMPDALGEFGLSPLSNAKQKMVEFIQHAQGPVTVNILWAVMARDMKQVDFRNSLSELTNAGKIMQVHTNEGEAYVYVDIETEETERILRLITE